MRTIITAALSLALAACGQASPDSQDAGEPAALAAAGNAAIDFGDDASRWANDNECDDKRFIDAGMTATPLLDEDIGHDATDCRTAYEAGNLQLRQAVPARPLSAPVDGTVDFGDDTSRWANDNECDDKRFTGPGMTETPLLDEDIGHDATDCRLAYEAGRLQLADGDAGAAPAK
ncbi:hypothetical protein [Alteraurantiacibacter buctensis]|uniref:Uncharacterized protein n=1 Tax=Alteraurantiacibacter buctensis TaxID=1503981 RepID=A0A844Z1D5_9SPHN|nr:hypothetical protein [Alteraurantiacibacter buctensis]MXO72514.1 hypothetical protein [Alteraurantiacibacter buctensis]